MVDNRLLEQDNGVLVLYGIGSRKDADSSPTDEIGIAHHKLIAMIPTVEVALTTMVNRRGRTLVEYENPIKQTAGYFI